MLTVNQTTRSYSGRLGCMCGCMGRYSTTERARKSAITALLKNPAVKFEAWPEGDGCLHVQTKTRNRVLYLTAEGVATLRAMGFKESVD